MIIETTDQVLDLINQIAATPGKNDKIALLKGAASNDLLRKVLVAAYNPLITYGIRKVPDRAVMGTDGEATNFRPETWGILENMERRLLTGNAMIMQVSMELEALSEKSAELFKRILLKDMRAGFSEETVNKVWPGAVPDFPYGRCSLLKDAKPEEWDGWEAGHISQEKADGMFINAVVEGNLNTFIYSRAGSMFPMEKFEQLANELSATFTADTQLHGELLVLLDGVVLPRETGNGILNSVLNGGDFGPGEKPMFLVWDQIDLFSVKPKGKFEVPYKTRLAGIIRQLKEHPCSSIRLIDTRIVRSLAEAYAHYTELLAKGKEGTILKKSSAIWKDGTSKEQVKLKLEFEVDLEILAVVPGRANTKNEGRAGSLTCGTKCRGLLVDVAIKGEAMRDHVDANPENWIGKIMPVTANMIMRPSESNTNHSLFLPRFTQSFFRTDKTVADDLARAIDIEVAAKEGKKIAEAA